MALTQEDKLLLDEFESILRRRERKTFPLALERAAEVTGITGPEARKLQFERKADISDILGMREAELGMRRRTEERQERLSAVEWERRFKGQMTGIRAQQELQQLREAGALTRIGETSKLRLKEFEATLGMKEKFLKRERERTEKDRWKGLLTQLLVSGGLGAITGGLGAALGLAGKGVSVGKAALLGTFMGGAPMAQTLGRSMFMPQMQQLPQMQQFGGFPGFNVGLGGMGFTTGQFAGTTPLQRGLIPS